MCPKQLGGTHAVKGPRGLKELAAFSDLQYLYIDNTKVTDTGLKHLTTLRGLSVLSLRGTKVSDAGVAELQKAVPHLKIER
jgi:internalin A